MTRVRLESVASAGRFSVDAQGHATGSVALCAAVSCLLQTLEGRILNEEAVDPLEVRLDAADAKLVWSGGAEAATAFDLAVVGFRRLAATDPARIAVTVEEKLFPDYRRSGGKAVL